MKNTFYIFHNFSGLTKSQPLPLLDRLSKIAQVKNYNSNVIEGRDSEKCFSRNFQFHRRDPTVHGQGSFDVFFRKDGLMGIVIMSGDVNSTMDDHIYYDNKLNLKKAGANTFFFQNHIVYAYINNERHVVTIELKPPS